MDKQIKRIFSDHEIRVFVIKEEPYFSVLDVCNVLGLKNSREQTSRLKKDGVRTAYGFDKNNIKRKLVVINEPNLYKLIFRSKKDEAEKFQDWVYEEVLPSIRKTGKYSIPEKIKDKSTKNRNFLTSEWQAHGVEKPHQFVQLTLQEYKQLGFGKDKRKKDMTRGEILLLSALESMEALKLFDNMDINGYYDCKNSLIETAKNVKQITSKDKYLETNIKEVKND